MTGQDARESMLLRKFRGGDHSLAAPLLQCLVRRKALHGIWVQLAMLKIMPGQGRERSTYLDHSNDKGEEWWRVRLNDGTTWEDWLLAEPGQRVAAIATWQGRYLFFNSSDELTAHLAARMVSIELADAEDPRYE